MPLHRLALGTQAEVSQWNTATLELQGTMTFPPGTAPFVTALSGIGSASTG